MSSVKNIACPQDLRPPARMLLAYIFAHEIAHALQGVGRHSKSGIMKAEWTIDDYRAMLAPPPGIYGARRPIDPRRPRRNSGYGSALR